MDMIYTIFGLQSHTKSETENWHGDEIFPFFSHTLGLLISSYVV